MRLLTPPGHGGVAVVAAAASERAAVLACLATPSGGPFDLETARDCVAGTAVPRLARLRWEGEVRDEVLVVDRGDAGLELHLHGSPALLRLLAARFGAFDPPAVVPANHLLQRALSVEQLQLAIEQRSCDFEAFLGEVERLPVDARAAALAAACRRSRVARDLATARRVVLVGRQNAGKSTLFNRLLFRERALTGPHAGLTRDPVAETTCLAGYPYELIDTAGEGETANPIDAAAVGQGRMARDGAVPLVVVDGSVGPTAIDRSLCTPGSLVIATKSDLPAAPWPADQRCDLRLCAADPATAAAVRTRVGELLRRHRGLPVAGPVGGPAALTDESYAALRRLASAAGVAEA